jgi:hypothetical protein
VAPKETRRSNEKTNPVIPAKAGIQVRASHLYIADAVHVLDPPPDRMAGLVVRDPEKRDWPPRIPLFESRSHADPKQRDNSGTCGDDKRSHFANNARNDSMQ